ncbi:hypothetical protein SAMN04487825_11476 [Prevotella sp. kh1p2]|nr:hypothetical protein SAMN04487825_11476 [Prevotella sp. kh1p2]SNU11819.1 hypothetical protein SAMN06298210_11429 [Prevotellaceae bacterium KH2P17]
MLLALFVNCMPMFSEEYSHNFRTKDFQQGMKTVDGVVEWTLDTDGPLAGIDDPKLHCGTTDKAISYLTLSTSSIKGEISSVSVVADCAQRQTATLEVKVGEKVFTYLDEPRGVVRANDKADTLFDFRGSSSGEISIKLSYAKKTKNALYIGKVVITYNDGTEEVIRLDEAVDNSTAITKAVSNGKQAVELHRTLSPDYWNTFCVPFAISADAINSTFGGAEIREFSGRVEGGVMIFTKTDSIKAGTPYLVKLVTRVENPKFVDVPITEVQPSAVQDETGLYAFVGIYSPYKLKTDGTEQFLGNGDYLKIPESEERATMNGMRAYFRLLVKQDGSGAKISIIDSTTTDISQLAISPGKTRKGVYTINGQHVGQSLQGLPQGIYIVDGHKIAIK